MLMRSGAALPDVAPINQNNQRADVDRQTRAYLYAAAAVLAWSTVASAFKLSLVYLEPVELLWYAALTSTLVHGVLLAVRGEMRVLRRWTGRTWLRSALFGLLNPFLYYLVLFEAYDRLPAQEAQPLNYVWPVVLVLFSAVFLRQRIGLRQFLAMMVCVAGVAVISTRGDLLGLRFTDTTGVLLALGSTVLWAGYWVLNMRDGENPLARLFANGLFGAIYVTVWVVLSGEVRLVPAAGLAGAAYVGVFEMGITFYWWIQALRLSRTTAQVSGLIFLAPFLSLVVIHYTVGEPIYPSTLAGLLLIVIGLVWLQRAGRTA